MNKPVVNEEQRSHDRLMHWKCILGHPHPLTRHHTLALANYILHSHGARVRLAATTGITIAKQCLSDRKAKMAGKCTILKNLYRILKRLLTALRRM